MLDVRSFLVMCDVICGRVLLGPSQGFLSQAGHQAPPVFYYIIILTDINSFGVVIRVVLWWQRITPPDVREQASLEGATL